MKLKQDLLFLVVANQYVIVDFTTFFRSDDWSFTFCQSEILFNRLKEHHRLGLPLTDFTLQQFAQKENLIFTQVEPEKPNTHLNFWLQTTNKCNLNCTYCYIPSLHSTQEIDPNLFDLLKTKILQEPNIQSAGIKISGGEPLLVFAKWHKEITAFKQALSQSGIRLHLQLNTNLVGFRKHKNCEQIIQFIKENQVNIAVSLDGTQEIHDAHRVIFRSNKGSFHNVMENILFLLEQGITPALLVTLTTGNPDHILPIIDFAVTHKLDFRICDVKGTGFTNQDFITVFNALAHYFEKKIQEGYLLSHHMLVSDLNLHRPQENPCAMGTKGAALYLNGDLYFCHSEFNKGKPIGTLSEKESLVEIIKRGKAIQYVNNSDCKKCNFRKVCASGCPLYRKESKSPMCFAHKTIIPQIFSLYIKEHLITQKGNDYEFSLTH